MLDSSPHILDQLLRNADSSGGTARYINAINNPAHNSAFGKLIKDPNQGHLRFSHAEVEAVRDVSKVMEERARAKGTGSTDGFAIPITIDPSIILSGSGALNPVRDVARTITVGTRE
jgi:hypothetical protein